MEMVGPTLRKERERETTTRVDMMGILNAKGNRENIRKT